MKEEQPSVDLAGKPHLEALKRWNNGQTMMEYALILAAVAIVVYGAYIAIGSHLESIINTVAGVFPSG
jgi:Flp pilus assembly pilin Flp